MPSRQSALRRGMTASAKSLSTTARRSDVSSTVGSWATIQPLASQSANDTIVTRHEELRSRQNPLEERRAPLQLIPEFFHRIHRGVDLPAEPYLGSPQRGNDLGECYVTDDEHVNVAANGFSPARDRTVNEGHFDAPLAQ